MCGSFSRLLIGRTAVHSGEGSSFCSLRSISFDGHFATAQQGRGPWVIRVDIAVSAVMSAVATSVLMQCSRPQLFAHLVGAGEQRWRHGETERLGSG